MDGVDRVIRRRKSLTERLGLKGIGCCGSTWGIMPATTFHVVDDENDVDVIEVLSHHIHTPPETPSATTCLVVGGRNSGMNLASALAAERHFRVDYDNNDEVNIHSGSRPGPTPLSRPDETGPRNDVPIYLGSRLGPDSHSSPLRPNEMGPRDDVPTYLGSRPDPNPLSRPDEMGPRDDVPTNLGSRLGLDSHSSSLRPDETGPRDDVPTYLGSRPDLGPHSRPDETGPRNDVPTNLGSWPGPDSHSSPLRPDERRLNSEVNIHSSSRSSSLRSDEAISRNVVETPTRMSLMRLLEETEVYEGELLLEDEEVGSDSVCCVCMRRKKGAAFIPCGHTFCRVCSRELWVNRGCCPLCNRSILEILDIY